MTNDTRYQATSKGGVTEIQPKSALTEISQALSGLRFGSVEIVVHDGKVTQIERKEKYRF